MSSKSPDNSASIEACFLASLGRQIANDAATTAECKKPALLIALSGGVDSVVLLSLASRLQFSNHSAAEVSANPVTDKFSVRAIYIDHGLQAQSAQWGEFCASLCRELNVAFECVPVTVNDASGLSLEAAARDARYQALQSRLQSGEYLCTAQHADDQAETLLLQLFRGAGVHGLASMPECREFGNGYLLRPLLQAGKKEILRYAEAHKLKWCEDPSNSDSRFDRNYLRNDFLPALSARWPQVVGNLSRSASHCAEAMELADELAQMDCANTVAPLSVSHLKSLSSVRQKNLLRYWISRNGYLAPSVVQLQQLLSDLVYADDNSQGRVNFGSAQVARYQGELYIGARDSFEPLPDFEYLWADSNTPLMISELNWKLCRAEHQNLAPYSGHSLTVRNRRGGERWRPDPAGKSLSVKSLLQDRRVPPWQRSRLVFVFHEQNLIDICGPEFSL